MKHLPDYMLRRLAAPGGTRLSKFKPFVVVTKQVWPPRDRPCGICKGQVPLKNIHGANSVDGHYKGGQYYHNNCFAQLPGGWRGAEKEKPSKGNLDNGDYRYWIGTRYPSNASISWAMCRCCRKSTHSSVERFKHLNDDSCAIGGERCAQRLIKAYKEMMASMLCVICKKNRYGKSTWGVPLCNSEDCLQAWMFSHDRYVALEAILMAQKKKAEFMEREKERKKSYVASGNIIPLEDWCTTCRMRASQLGHAEIHAAWGKMEGMGE